MLRCFSLAHMLGRAGAARFLHLVTGDERYAKDYRRIWQCIADYVRDPTDGSWFHELDESGDPVAITWPGKPDLYHALQATLYAFMPVGQGIAAWAHYLRESMMKRASASPTRCDTPSPYYALSSNINTVTGKAALW